MSYQLWSFLQLSNYWTTSSKIFARTTVLAWFSTAVSALASHKTVDGIITKHGSISAWYSDVTLHLLACQSNRRGSGSQSRGSHRQSLSQDTERVKNHMAIFPYYHRQLISLEGTHFACRHHSPGVWAGEGWAGQNRSGRRAQGNGWGRAASCLPRGPARGDLLIQGSKGAPDCPHIPLPRPCTMQMKPFPQLHCCGSSCQNAQRLQWDQYSPVFLKEERCVYCRETAMMPPGNALKPPPPVLPCNLSSADTRTMYASTPSKHPRVLERDLIL